jgi:hypothetical protein
MEGTSRQTKQLSLWNPSIWFSFYYFGSVGSPSWHKWEILSYHMEHSQPRQSSYFSVVDVRDKDIFVVSSCSVLVLGGYLLLQSICAPTDTRMLRGLHPWRRVTVPKEEKDQQVPGQIMMWLWPLLNSQYDCLHKVGPINVHGNVGVGLGSG